MTPIEKELARGSRRRGTSSSMVGKKPIVLVFTKAAGPLQCSLCHHDADDGVLVQEKRVGSNYHIVCSTCVKAMQLAVES